ncbi:hypothetical protein [Thalassobius sp. Cn5-15]|uniref:hypothetical protein n=1 Tax=Thalassobius sp. Cn5-15 TaxID=2917763 RepID=UPI001EF2E666|nr:hypothetical protein [Thalassobius sp. Cn5-15]MCG7493091.1 hypothetical protein [Thalassobius sp. Cn5-15]
MVHLRPPSCLRPLLWLCLGLCLAACSRPLTDSERRYAQTFYGDSVDLDRVRFVEGHFAGSVRWQFQPRPRVTCQERIFPPVTGDVLETAPGAVALYQRVFYRRDLYRDDFTQSYSAQISGRVQDRRDGQRREATNLYDLMIFAHEMTHVWQWQNRAQTGYTPWRAAGEHGQGRDPYLFDLNSQPDFLSFPYEQQAAIVEEFTCCRALAPKAARTKRLHDMLAQVMPVQLLQSRIDTLATVPWEGAEVTGICD